MAMSNSEKYLRQDVRRLALDIFKINDWENPEKLKNYILNEAEEIQILKNSNGDYIGARILITKSSDEIIGVETFNNGTFGIRDMWGLEDIYRFRYDLADGLSERIDDIIKSTL